MGKTGEKGGISPNEVAELAREGWRFRVKVVKGRRYITAMRGRRERSLGPYSEELLVLTRRLRGEEHGQAEGSVPTPLNKGEEGKHSLTVILDAIQMRI